jgi:ribonucleoside-diphosphate reductase beta chain
MKKPKLSDTRDYFKPFTYPEFYDIWLAHEQSHWLFSEVPMLEDVKDWKTKLSVEEKYFLTQIFRFFTQSDLDVAGGYIDNYLPKFKQPEIRMMLCGFVAREALHVAAYSHLIETLGMPESTYNEFNEYEAMKQKHDYFIEKVENNASTAIKIAAISAFTEGLALFSSFIMLLNFQRHGKMKGMGQIITWSIVDETMHTEAMIKLFRLYVEENRNEWNDKTKGQIYSICEKMVELEDQFIDLAFQMGSIQGLRDDEVKKYIRYIADRRLISMGLKGIYKVKKNPLPWVEEIINAPIHTNFFENRSTDYAKGALTGTWEDIWG